MPFISDLEWFVMTPALLQQFRLYYADDQPIGVLLWASVSPEVEENLSRGIAKLRPQDWKSGDRLWVTRQRASKVVEIIAPFGGAEAMLQDLKVKVFPDKPVRVLELKDSKQQVKVV